MVRMGEMSFWTKRRRLSAVWGIVPTLIALGSLFVLSYINTSIVLPTFLATGLLYVASPVTLAKYFKLKLGRLERERVCELSLDGSIAPKVDDDDLSLSVDDKLYSKKAVKDVGINVSMIFIMSAMTLLALPVIMPLALALATPYLLVHIYLFAFDHSPLMIECLPRIKFENFEFSFRDIFDDSFTEKTNWGDFFAKIGVNSNGKSVFLSNINKPHFKQINHSRRFHSLHNLCSAEMISSKNWELSSKHWDRYYPSHSFISRGDARGGSISSRSC